MKNDSPQDSGAPLPAGGQGRGASMVGRIAAEMFRRRSRQAPDSFAAMRYRAAVAARFTQAFVGILSRKLLTELDGTLKELPGGVAVDFSVKSPRHVVRQKVYIEPVADKDGRYVRVIVRTEHGAQTLLLCVAALVRCHSISYYASMFFEEIMKTVNRHAIQPEKGRPPASVSK